MYFKTLHFNFFLALLGLCLATTLTAQTLVPATGNNAVTCGTNTTLCDAGGCASNYAANASGYTVLNNGGSSVISLSGTYTTENTYDFVYVYAGVGTGGTLLGTFTGTGSINITSSPGQALTVQFTSDGIFNDVGFSLNVAYAGSCLNLIPASGSSSVACGTNTVLYDNGGLANYANNSNGYTVLNNGATGVININGNYTTEAANDVIRIYAGAGTGGTLLGTFSGAGTINYTGTAGQTLTVEFVSNATTANTGFALTITYTGSCFVNQLVPLTGSNSVACGVNTILCDHAGCGTNYSNNANGFTVLNAAGSSVINISGTYATESTYDFVRIYSGSGVGGTLLASYSGSGSINYTGTAGQTLTLQFTSDVSTVGAGFSVNVSYSGSCATTVPLTGNNSINCGSSGALCDHAGCGSNYGNNANGYTVLNNAASGVITLTGNYDTEAGGDFIRIYNGSGTGGTLLQTLSGIGTVNFVSSPGQVITVQFTSNGAINSSGFSFNVAYTGSCIDPCNNINACASRTTCNAFSYDSGGSGSGYANSQNFTQTIYPSVPGQVVRLTFTAFDTESSYDYLYIYNGNSIGAPLVGSYSGLALPPTFTSTAADGSITLNFTSDGSTTATGWAAIVTCICPTATSMQYGSSFYCSGVPNPTPTLVGPVGGVYSATPAGLSLNTSTGQINLGTSNSGVYEVSYIICGVPVKDTVTVSNLSVNIAPINVLCNGGNTGSATAVVTGGTAPITFLWSNGRTTAANTGLVAGTYTITATDASGCTNSNTIVITQPNVLTLTTNATSPSCGGGNNGTANAFVSGGTLAYSYLWSNGRTTAINTGLTAGTYTIALTDANGCTANSAVTVSNPAPITATMSSSNITCFGTNTGNASVVATGGQAPYTYLWNNGRTTAANAALVAGTYTVTVTDANGCSLSNSATITQPASAVTASILFIANATCFGTADGTATAVPAGGTAPYSFSWSNGRTTNSTTGLAAGVYTVVVTDAAACNFTTNVTITQPASALAVSVSNTNISCFGGNTATATATASGGTPIYFYLWSNGRTTATNTGLTAGTYVVTLTDANGCRTTAGVVVNQPSSALVLSAGGTNIACFGANTGSALANVTGGTATYSYLWSNGRTTASNTGLTAGTYTLTTTDANACTATATVNISQPAAALSATLTSSNITCAGATNGGASVTAAGGTAPYTYIWNNGRTTASNSGLTAGTYTTTVTDANGCAASGSVTITQPASGLSITIVGTTVIPCFGGNTGNVTANVSGGTAPYTYIWSNGRTTAANASLTAGVYNVIVTDAAGCNSNRSVTISQPASQLSATINSANISCFGNTDGSATAVPSGGTPGYLYLWSTSANTPTITGLTAGAYSVTIIDANICTYITSVIITQPSSPIVSTITSTNLACFGANNGTAIVTASGGATPYSYLWSNGRTTANNTGLTAGTYTITTSDAGGCTSIRSVTITQPATSISVALSSTAVSCNGASNGTATATASGGSLPYNYVWSNAHSTAINSGLTAGNYTVSASDANGCSVSGTISVSQPASALNVSIPFPTDVSCFGGSNGLATSSATGGTAPYSFSWSNGRTTATNSGLTSGLYTVVATDANGCIGNASVSVGQPTLLAANTTTIPASCFGTNTGGAVVAGSGGVTPYSYQWSNGVTTASNFAITAGTYLVTLTDFNGCTLTRSVAVVQPASALHVSANVTNVICSGNGNGSATAIVTGGTPLYSFLWSNGRTTANNTGLIGGSYSLTATDANGCNSTTTVFVNEPAVLNAVTTSSNIACHGATNGSIGITATGGTLPRSFVWSNGTTGTAAGGLSAGTYTISVTDGNGCSVTRSVTITEPSALSISMTQTNPNCIGGGSGSATPTVTGGIAPYRFAWSNGVTTANNPTLAAGIYSLIVTDANGCNIASGVTIIQSSTMNLSTTGSSVACFGNTNGTASATVSNGTAPYSFLWSSGQTTANVTGLTGGVYAVTVSDFNGCTVSRSATVTTPSQLVLAASATNVLCFGNTNGTADATCTGGTTPYRFLWSNGSTNASVVSGAATYTVTATDANGCTATRGATITQPSAALHVALTGTAVSCRGGSNGAANSQITGGTAPYSILWSTGATTGNITNLIAANYAVTVTDAHGCSERATILVTQPTANISISNVSTHNVACNGANDGYIAITVVNGAQPFSYAWSNGYTGSFNTDLPGGVYSVVVTDANGCSATAGATLTSPAASITPSTTITNGSCPSCPDGTASVSVTGGVPPYTYHWTNGATATDLTGLLPALYLVTVTDANGCVGVGSALISFGTGVAHLGELEQVRAYPNPANTVLYIDNLPLLANVRLVDVWGRVVYRELNVQTLHSIDVQALVPAVYFLQIETDKELHTIRIIKE